MQSIELVELYQNMYLVKLGLTLGRIVPGFTKKFEFFAVSLVIILTFFNAEVSFCESK